MFDYLNEILLWSKTNGRRRKDGTLAQAQRLKLQGDAFIVNRLCEVFVSRFKWTSEDPDIAAEMIEPTILAAGSVAFAKIQRTNGNIIEENWRICRPSGYNNLSFYGYPTQCTLTDYAGRVLGRFIPALRDDPTDLANCALCFDNPLRWMPLRTILYYADRLSVINTSINAAIQNILGTTVITCEREQALSIEKQRRAALIGVPYIINYEAYERNSQPEILTAPGTSEALKTLYEAWDKTYADFQQAIGIKSNNSIDKKSGVTPLEILTNRQVIDIDLNACYDMRQEAIKMCEKIGLTGLKCELDRFDDNTGDYNMQGQPIGKEGESDAGMVQTTAGTD